jgi:hypothetical protein
MMRLRWLYVCETQSLTTELSRPVLSHLCLRFSLLNPGWTFCPKSYFLAENCLEVSSWFGQMDRNTSVSLEHHVSKQADYSVLNASILSIGDRYPTSTPMVYSHDLLELYDYVLNNDTAGLANPNVTSQSLISNLMYLQSIQTKIPVSFHGSNMLRYLQAFVALPLLMFQPTWTVDPNTLGTIPDLVPNVTTTGVFSKTIPRILIAKWTAVTFVAMLVSVYCQCIMCLYWATKNPGQSSTQFPVLDFAVSLYYWNKPIARLLSSRGELDSGLYRQNLEQQALGAEDREHDQSVLAKGVWNGPNHDIAGYCYTRSEKVGGNSSGFQFGISPPHNQRQMSQQPTTVLPCNFGG